MESKMISSITKHPIWLSLWPMIRDEEYNRDGSAVRPRLRYEIDSEVSVAFAKRLLRVRVKCAHCGKPIHPIRARKGKGNRMEVPRHLYIAVACPLNVSVGCSRSRAAAAEYSNIENRLIYERMIRKCV